MFNPCTGPGQCHSPAFCVDMCRDGCPHANSQDGQWCSFCLVGVASSSVLGPPPAGPCLEQNIYAGSSTCVSSGDGDPYGLTSYWFVLIQALGGPLEPNPRSCLGFTLNFVIFCPQAASLTVADPTSLASWLAAGGLDCSNANQNYGVSPYWDACTFDPTTGVNVITVHAGTGVSSITCYPEGGDCAPSPCPPYGFMAAPPRPQATQRVLGRPQPPPVVGPSLVRKAFNFSKAVVRHVRGGLKMVDEAEQARRLAICKGCNYFDPVKTVCNHKSCGCRLKLKSTMAMERCPLGLWDQPALAPSNG